MTLDNNVPRQSLFFIPVGVRRLRECLDLRLVPPPFLARWGESSPLFELRSAIDGDSAPAI